MSARKSHAELQALLDSQISRTDITAPVESRPQTLPLHQLTWGNFERLCARVIAAESAVFECHRYGKPGEDQSGIDILARRWAEGQVERWAYQCKKYARFTAKDVHSAIQSLELEADFYVLLISSGVGRAVRDAATSSPTLQIWDEEDLSRRLKDHPRIVEDFFGSVWRRSFCGDAYSPVPDSNQSAVRRLIGVDLKFQEWLHSNLLPVTKIPTKIYSAPLPLKPSTATDAEAMARIPPLKQVRGKIWSLAPLGEPAIAGLVGCDPAQAETTSIDKWLPWTRERNWLRELFYSYVRRRCAALGMAYDEAHRRFYFTPENGSARIRTYQAFKRRATRQLAYPYYDKESGQLRFWVHHAARLTFSDFGTEFYLKVEPGYAFTKNGVDFLASEDIGPLATRRKSGERNQNVFNHIIFWSEILASPGGEINIDCDGQLLVISKMFESTKTGFGIPSDSIPIADVAMAEDELDLGLLASPSDDEEAE